MISSKGEREKQAEYLTEMVRLLQYPNTISKSHKNPFLLPSFLFFIFKKKLPLLRQEGWTR